MQIKRKSAVTNPFYTRMVSSPSLSPIGAKLTPDYSNKSADGLVELVILSQPEEQHRASYLTEGSLGAIKDTTGTGHPAVKLTGYHARQPILLECYIGHDKHNGLPHLFYQASKISGENLTRCKACKVDGTSVVVMNLLPEQGMQATIDCIGIKKENNVDVEQKLLSHHHHYTPCELLEFADGHHQAPSTINGHHHHHHHHHYQQPSILNTSTSITTSISSITESLLSTKSKQSHHDHQAMQPERLQQQRGHNLDSAINRHHNNDLLPQQTRHHEMGDSMTVDSRRQSVRCRLVFRVKIPETGEVLQITSTPIVCTQPLEAPEVCREPVTQAPIMVADNNLELFVIGEKHAEDSKLVFRNRNNEWIKVIDPKKEFLNSGHTICSLPNCDAPLEPMQMGARDSLPAQSLRERVCKGSEDACTREYSSSNEMLRQARSNSQSSIPTSLPKNLKSTRKISATDFETRTGSGFLRPMLNKTPDGRFSFLLQPRPNGRDSDFHQEPKVSPTPDGNQSRGAKAMELERQLSRLSVASEAADTSAPPIDAQNGIGSEENVKKTNDEVDERPNDSEMKLIFELIENIYDDLDIRTLLHKILKNIAVLINADRSSLFLVCGEADDPNRRLVSQLFNVDQDSIDDGQPEESIVIPWGKGLVGYVAESGETINITNCYDDPRFTDAVDQRTGYRTRHMICAPILDKSNEIVGVAQVINRRDGCPFSKSDEVKFKRYLQFCGIGLRNAQSYEQCELENRRNQVLLDLARMVFEEQSSLEQVVHRIMLHTQSLLDCERCQVLLIDDVNDELENLNNMPCSHRNPAAGQANEHKLEKGPDETGQDTSDRFNRATPKLFTLVFDLDCDGNKPVIYDSKKDAGTSAAKRSGPLPINIGIAGYVAMTGETLNIKNAQQHERFDASTEQATSNFRHKSILCMPIRNGQRRIIGVIQLINKRNGQPFNKNDEDLFEAFAIFCGLGIHNTLMYERVLKIMAKQKVTFEVLSYHATAPLEEAKKLSQEQIPSCFALNLTSLKFNDFSLDDQYMLKSCLRFFLDLDLIRRFQIDRLVFCNWILSVQKNYRKVTYHPIVGGDGLKASPVRYHNWRHAFNVSQMMFAILVNTQLCNALGELETLALLIASLCHDLDHRGTNNSFQIKSASPLAELYSTSTMEHHHFDQCVMILNSQGNQILANLSPEEYSKVIMLLEEAILATDLANYFRNRDLYFQLVNSNNFDWKNNGKHRSLLRCMLMTACDVAAITKPWSVQKIVADLVMSEFYQQGDIERNELKIEPVDMMNRDKMNELPALQIGFIDTVCAPIYTAFAKLFPDELTTLLDGCLTNRNIWNQLSEGVKQQDIPSTNRNACDNDGVSEEHNTLPSSVTSRSDVDIPRETDGNKSTIRRPPAYTSSCQRKSV